MSRLYRFGLVSDLALQNSPSRRDNMSPEIEANRRKFAARHIYETSHTFQTSVGTAAIAVTFFLRYFTRKSMKRNEPFIVACGCLFLAGKVNDEPLSVAHLAVEMFKRWYGRDNPAMRARLAEPNFVAQLTAAALEAERAVLYTVGFDFNVDLPHTHVAALLRTPRFDYLKHNLKFHQLAINFCNDVMRRDGTLVLQYPCRDIAIAIYYFLFKQLKKASEEDQAAIPQPQPEPDGVHWYVKEGLDVQRCLEITRRIQNLYAVRPAGAPAASSQPVASAATTLMPGESTYMPAASVGGGAGAASESAAAAGSVAAGGGLGGAVDSTAGAPPPATQRSPRGPAASSAGVGQKRPAEGALGGTPASKLPRVAPSSSTAQAPPAAVAGTEAASLGPGAAAAPAATARPAPAVPAAAPAAEAASDKEEGELEEGELPE